MVSISLVLSPFLLNPNCANAEGNFMDKYVKREKLEPLETYVPAVILTQSQIEDLDKTLEGDKPQFALCRSLLRSGPAASLCINIRAVAQYASDSGNGKTAFNNVDKCLRSIEELDSLLLRASRNDPGASVKSMKTNVKSALIALDNLSHNCHLRPPDLFRNPPPHLSMGMNLNNMAKMLKCAGNDDIITIKADDGSDTVTFMFESPTQDKISDFEMKLLGFTSLCINIRAVAQYASDSGNGKTAFNNVDECLRSIEELDSLLLRASRNDPGASVKSIKTNVKSALIALDSLSHNCHLRPPDLFRNPPPHLSMGMNLNNRAKMLKCAGNDDIITIKADDGSDTVTFMFESPTQD
ncbi:hypothetical protein RYX36_009829 [Vicia faba]